MPLSPNFSYELSLLPANTRYLLGIDEVGRGPWAGPVTVGAFLLDLASFNPDYFRSLKLRDSKLVSPQNRLRLYSELKNQGFNFTVLSAPSQEIDRQGIAVTIVNLVNKSLKHFSGSFDYALIDGNINLCHNFCRSVVKADRDCFSVAAASVCAKVSRDQTMDEYDLLYPQYGFSSHKGYGTAAHLKALQKFGPCPIHRLSYKPIKNLVNL